MPIFEYKCVSCEKDFEFLAMGSRKATCPSCGSEEVKKKFSVFGMSGVEKPFAGSSSGCSSCSKTSCSSCSWGGYYPSTRAPVNVPEKVVGRFPHP